MYLSRRNTCEECTEVGEQAGCSGCPKPAAAAKLASAFVPSLAGCTLPHLTYATLDPAPPQPFCDVCNRDGQCTSCSLVIDMEHGAYTLVGKTCKPCGVRDW